MALRGFLPSLGCLGVGAGFHSALPFSAPLHPRLLFSGWVLTCGYSPLPHFFLRLRGQGQAHEDRRLSRLWDRSDRTTGGQGQHLKASLARMTSTS